jgi:predicted negative regulator of RcsB-dependent stress response
MCLGGGFPKFNIPMSTPNTPSPVSGDQQPVAAEAAVITPGFEETLRAFWEKNGKLVIIVCVVVLLAIIGRGAYGVIAAQREAGVATAYGAATTSDQLKSFASANPGHLLAGAAHLRLADEAYAAGRYPDAQSEYGKAAPILKDSVFASRIQLGLAMAKLNGGDAAAGEAALKALADDVSGAKSIRAEAAYHLAIVATAAGRADEASKLAEQVMSIDPESIWTQRALMLRARTAVQAPAAAPVAPATAPAEAAPAIQFKIDGK